jgi:hypothetical protein
MTNKQKRTLIIASIIGTLLACYREDEKTKLHRVLHLRIGTGTGKFVKQHGKDIVEKVAYSEGNSLWREVVDYFADKERTIEASACVLQLWNKDEKQLGKYFGLSRAKIGRWASPTKRKDAVELERNSRDVADMVFDKINKLYGIEVEKKMGLMERIALNKQKNMKHKSKETND